MANIRPLRSLLTLFLGAVLVAVLVAVLAMVTVMAVAPALAPAMAMAMTLPIVVAVGVPGCLAGVMLMPVILSAATFMPLATAATYAVIAIASGC